jgi:uncharacterized protein (DUF433 family)
MVKRRIGEFIVLDPAVCLGAPTFRGTHVTVADVLDRVADGDTWDVIVEHFGGAITSEAIAEALRLAGDVLMEYARVPPKDELDAPPTVYGDYIVADPGICHGAPTFRGTRLFVADALEFVAAGLDWDTIVWELHGNIPREAIAESIRLASGSLREHASDYVLVPART